MSSVGIIVRTMCPFTLDDFAHSPVFNVKCCFAIIIIQLLDIVAPTLQG